jgi:hypothetical protein
LNGGRNLSSFATPHADPARTVANHREGGESEDTTTFHDLRHPVYGYEFFLKAFRAIAHAVVCAHKFTSIRS